MYFVCVLAMCIRLLDTIMQRHIRTQKNSVRGLCTVSLSMVFKRLKAIIFFVFELQWFDKLNESFYEHTHIATVQCTVYTIGILLYITVHHCTPLYIIIHHCTPLYITVHYYTILQEIH